MQIQKTNAYTKNIYSSDSSKRRKDLKPTSPSRPKPMWNSTLPCEILAYIAIHTFGIRMIYPGSVKLIQSFLHPMLVQGRAKLTEEENGNRYKLKTIDDNVVDAFFVDNREKNQTNGKTLVICSEGDDFLFISSTILLNAMIVF